MSAMAQQHDAWVFLKQKMYVDAYLANPETMLSAKALERRQRQNIAVDVTDVPIAQQYINQLSNHAQVEIKAKSKWLNAVHVRGELEAIQSLANLPIVERLEYADKTINGKRKKTSGVYTDKWINTESDYGESVNQVQMLNGHLLHQQGYTGSGVTIAVLDNGYVGVDTAQPFDRLRNEGNLLGGYNFVENSENYFSGGTHGTRVLSTMAGYTQGALIGAAIDAKYYLFVTEDTTDENPVEESYWVAAAELADSLGVDVINTSLGYNYFSNSNYNYTYQDMNGITTFISRGLNMAASKGILCVNSAGNEGHKDWKYITAPADAQGAFTVGAVTAQGVYAPFSSIGTSSDGRVKPDVVAQGVMTVLSDEYGNISHSNGTSFSSPIIAGLMACLWQTNLNLTNYELMQKVRQSASLYQNPNEQFGYGIPDFYQAFQNLNNAQHNSTTLKIYPNPVTDYLAIQSSENDFLKIEMWDMYGKKVLEQEVEGSLTIPTTTLANGIYIYKINQGGKHILGKIIKQ